LGRASRGEKAVQGKRKKTEERKKSNTWTWKGNWAGGVYQTIAEKKKKNVQGI